MSRKLLICFGIACAATLFGCKSADERACRSKAEPEIAVMTEIQFARQVDGVSDGFDLDGLSSVEDGFDGSLFYGDAPTLRDRLSRVRRSGKRASMAL